MRLNVQGDDAYLSNVFFRMPLFEMTVQLHPCYSRREKKQVGVKPLSVFPSPAANFFFGTYIGSVGIMCLVFENRDPFPFPCHTHIFLYIFLEYHRPPLPTVLLYLPRRTTHRRIDGLIRTAIDGE